MRLALKDLELVREVEQSSKAAMPLLDVVHERFLAANEDMPTRIWLRCTRLGDPASAES